LATLRNALIDLGIEILHARTVSTTTRAPLVEFAGPNAKRTPIRQREWAVDDPAVPSSRPELHRRAAATRGAPKGPTISAGVRTPTSPELDRGVARIS
jgi:hypothetical protein